MRRFLSHLRFTNLPWRGGLALLATGLVLGCGLDLGDAGAPEIQKNSCESDDECGGGACLRGLCQQPTSQISVLLLEVIPPSGTPVVAGVNFSNVIDEFEQAPAGGVEINVGHISQVNAAVSGKPISSDDCVLDPSMEQGAAADDGSLSVRMTMLPRERLLGMPSPALFRLSDPPEKNSSGGHRVDIGVPPGRYDFYVEPQTTDNGCVRPPYLVVDRELLPGDVEFSLEMPVPQALTVKVVYPQKVDDLANFRLEIVERDSGRLLSNRPQLGVPVETDEGLEYSVQLAFSQIESEQENLAAELIRLTPPEDVIAPSIYVERSVVDIFRDGEGVIDQLTHLPAPVLFGGHVAIAKGSEGAEASVNFVATEIAATDSGTIASFSRTVSTLPSGEFQVALLPGAYRVRIEPIDPSLASLESEVIVSEEASVQYGKTFELGPRRRVSGRLKGFRGESVSGISVTAIASLLSTSASVLTQARGLQTFVPGSTGESTAGDGSFNILADRGVFDFIARPQSSSGYAWRVLPRVSVEEGDISLGEISLPLPVVVRGSVRSEDIGLVPEALVRAYAFMKDGELVGRAQDEEVGSGKAPAEADSVIAVAETRADEEGQFRLLLPSVFK